MSQLGANRQQHALEIVRALMRGRQGEWLTYKEYPPDGRQRAYVAAGDIRKGKIAAIRRSGLTVESRVTPAADGRYVVEVARADTPGPQGPRPNAVSPEREPATERRAQYVQAARRVATRDSLAKMSLRAVAAEAGVQLSTLQYEFPSKRNLVDALIADVVDEIGDILHEAPLEQGADMAEAVSAGLTRWWSRLVEGNPESQTMQYQLVLHSLQDDTHRATAKWQYRRYLESFTAWLRTVDDATGSKTALPMDEIARVLFAQLDGLVLQYVVKQDAQAARRDLERALSMSRYLFDASTSQW